MIEWVAHWRGGADRQRAGGNSDGAEEQKPFHSVRLKFLSLPPSWPQLVRNGPSSECVRSFAWPSSNTYMDKCIGAYRTSNAYHINLTQRVCRRSPGRRTWTERGREGRWEGGREDALHIPFHARRRRRRRLKHSLDFGRDGGGGSGGGSGVSGFAETEAVAVARLVVCYRDSCRRSLPSSPLAA